MLRSGKYSVSHRYLRQIRAGQYQHANYIEIIERRRDRLAAVKPDSYLHRDQ